MFTWKIVWEFEVRALIMKPVTSGEEGKIRVICEENASGKKYYDVTATKVVEHKLVPVVGAEFWDASLHSFKIGSVDIADKHYVVSVNPGPGVGKWISYGEILGEGVYLSTDSDLLEIATSPTEVKTSNGWVLRAYPSSALQAAS